MSFFISATKANRPRRNVNFISSAGFYSIALDKRGKVWGWGYNFYGNIGDGTTVNRSVPVSIAGAAKTFCKIDATYGHSVAIDKNGRAWGWGYNFAGSIGDNSVALKCTPVSVVGQVKTFCKISAGLYTTHAIDKNGRLWGWGGGFNGAIGDNSLANRLTPVSVLGAVKTFCEISGSPWYHTMAIDKNGRAWGWGYNAQGQLGNNSTASRRTPVSVAGTVKTFCKIHASFLFTTAIDKYGKIWGWGRNTSFELGDGTSINRLTPVSIAGASKTFCKISNYFHGLAIDKNGQIWAWGDNNRGQLGDGTTTPRSSPVSIAGVKKTFCEISAGDGNSFAVDKNGRAWAWGYGGNVISLLGNNSTLDSTTPIRVCNI